MPIYLFKVGDVPKLIHAAGEEQGQAGSEACSSMSQILEASAYLERINDLCHSKLPPRQAKQVLPSLAWPVFSKQG
jgi:hypothetical protein